MIRSGEIMRANLAKTLFVAGFVLLFILAMTSPALAEGEITVTRDISEQNVAPGDVFRVTVSIYANQDITPPLLNESVPSGWTVTRGSDDAAYMKNQGDGFVRWVWLAGMSAGESKTVTYNVEVPSDCENGKYYIDGFIFTLQVDPVLVEGETELTVGPDGGVYEVPLYEGWNLISIPFTPDDPSIASVLSQITGKYSIVWAYEASEAADVWKKYDPRVPFGNDLLRMESGKGYWILMTSDAVLVVSGTGPASTIPDMQSGWNLIGFGSLSSQPIRDALSPITGSYRIVWAYEAEDAADPWKKFDPDVPFGNDLLEMKPGNGYWIMVV